MKTIKIFAMAILCITGMSCSHQKQNYPAAPEAEVTDDYFGTTVKDPFRTLENDTAPETLEWVIAENALTESYLSAIPYREKIRERLKELNNFKKTSLPQKKKDGRYYFSVNDGLQNQSVIYRSDSLGGAEELFLDPNTFSEDGTVALNGIYQSNDGKYTAYIISRSGSDWNEIFVMETDSKKLLPDHIEWVKFSAAQWQGDGFYYSSYPKPEAGKEYSNANENHQIYFHKIGTPQSQDVLIYEDKAHPLHFHTAAVPKSEGYLFVMASGEGSGNSILYKDLKGDGIFKTLEPTQDYDHLIMDVEGSTAYILTNMEAPKYRLMAVNLNKPDKSNWKEVIPETDGVLTGVEFVGDKILAVIQQDAIDHIYIYDKNGTRINEISMPVPGSIGLVADKDSGEVFYSLTSFAYPSARYAYNMQTNESTFLGANEIEGINLDDFITEQVFFSSSDGTRIPMFITYKKGTEMTGNNPTLLYGYGGFNVSLTPGFNASRLLWLENGGVLAYVNLRGGGEYGEEWHEAGTKLNKKNVFNDFIGAAEYLIDAGWTSPEYLVIEGGSNGGLLVGATVNMRPDLFKVAIPQVGVMDMMRYHLFTIGWNWASDYGTSADSKEMADYLLSYSPIHNIKNDGTPYPAILITTADHDDRVVPAHSFKYAATLQASDTGDAPKLIRIESNAGHGGGKPISKVIDERTDIYSFIYNNLGVEPSLNK